MKRYNFIRKTIQYFLVTIVIFLSELHYARANEIVVSAAVSLSNAFKEIGTLYEKKHPMNKIIFNFGASGSLLQQIDQGAPVDVFASADQETMNQAIKKKLIIERSNKNFVYNSLVLITPIDRVLPIQKLNDLLHPSLQKIAIGQPYIVPAGRYTQKLLQQDHLWDKLQTKLIIGQNVRQVLDYVVRDEVNVGFVYHSDAMIMQDKVKILLDFPLNHSICYPIALVKQKIDNKDAQEFIDFVLSSTGQEILKKYGFIGISH